MGTLNLITKMCVNVNICILKKFNKNVRVHVKHVITMKQIVHHAIYYLIEILVIINVYVCMAISKVLANVKVNNILNIFIIFLLGC